MVESLSLTQEIVGLSTAIFYKITLFLSLNSTFRENSNKSTATGRLDSFVIAFIKFVKFTKNDSITTIV